MTKPPAKIDTEETEESLDVGALEPLFIPEKRDLGVKIVTTMVRQTHHSGPLPSPETYGQYEVILPGSAERILRMAEKEQDHRHKGEQRVVTHEFGIRYAGQIGAILALMMLCGSVIYCAMIGQPFTAGVIAAIGAIVTGFLRFTQMKLDMGPDETSPPPPPPPAKRNQKQKKR